MTAVRIVPAFNVPEDRRAGLGRRVPPPPIDEFRLERGKEALGHRVVVAVADRAVRRDDAEFLAALPER